MSEPDERAEKFKRVLFAAILCVIGFIVLLVGSGIVYLVGPAYLEGRKTLALAEYTSGTITKATEHGDIHDEDGGYSVEFEYAFTDRAGVVRHGQQALNNKLPVGARVRVVYRRDQPDFSELVTGDVGRNGELAIVGGAAGAALFGAVMLFFGLRHGRTVLSSHPVSSRPPPLPLAD